MTRKFRGSLRLGSSSGGDGDGPEEPEDEGVLSAARKVIPGEALAGYVALKVLSEAAADPASVSIVLALTFLFVTIVLRIIGTMPPVAPFSLRSVQWSVVTLSGATFIALVYATEGQIWWHEAAEDQAIYGQIVASALGIIVTPLLAKLKAGQ